MSTNFISCPECQHTFSARKNLYKHVRKFHSSLVLDELKSRKKCRVCIETFDNINDLEAHMQLLHNSAFKNKCSHCQSVFKTRKNLHQHLRNFHPSDQDEYKDKKQTLVCSICNQKFLHMTDLHSHFKSDHPDITLSFQENIFHSVEDFEIWKAEIERETQSHFSKKCGDQQLVDGRICMRFYCHRSGVFEPKKTRMRRVKNIGSHKIGKTCPAYITAYKKTVLDATEIQVHYQSVHVGHKCEVARLPLSHFEKVELARHMNLGVPKSYILNSLRRNYSPTKRLSLTHRKDLHNICRDYKISSTNSNDDLAIDIDEEDINCNEHHAAISGKLKRNVISDLDQKKALTFSKLQSLLSRCQSTEITAEELDTIIAGINVINSRLDAVSASRRVLPSLSTNNCLMPANKKIVVQHRFSAIQSAEK